jgi:hypothetical protein
MYWHSKISLLAGTVAVIVHVVGLDGSGAKPPSLVVPPELVPPLPPVSFEEEVQAAAMAKGRTTRAPARVRFTALRMT